MTEDWAAAAADIEAALAEAGADATLEKQPANVGTAWAPQDGAPTTTPVKVLLGSVDETSGARTFTAGASVAIEAGDRLLFMGDWFQIKPPVRPVAPGGVLLLYKFEAERSSTALA